MFINEVKCLRFDQNNGEGKVEGWRWNKSGQQLIPIKLDDGHMGGYYAIFSTFVHVWKLLKQIAQKSR